MLNILFPDICNGCNTPLAGNEEILCITCRHQLPLTCFHATNNNVLKGLFNGKIAVEKATSLLFFEKKSITQELLHNLKYRKQKQISNFLGKWLGEELAKKNYTYYIIPIQSLKVTILFGFNTYSKTCCKLF